MKDPNFEKRLAIVGGIIREVDDAVSFSILEIGALPVKGQAEPFHQLLDIFPGSRITAFEVDKNVCDELNREAKPGMRFFPVALGRTEEQRPFYETNHPMCSSLYMPNEKLISLYNGMDVAMLKSVSTIQTTSMDRFIQEHDLGSVDFIKIDIQGAELDVFRGGINTLRDVLAIVSEVEFVHHYVDQPLFGDVCAFLAENDLMFHKFIGMAGRSLKPIVIANDPFFPTQHMWSDALYIRDVFAIPDLPSGKLLKLGMLAFLYRSPDVTFQCFKRYDERHGTEIHKLLFNLDERAKEADRSPARRKKKKIKGLR